ncbi:MAG: NAD(P)/FAD-dependent oxidoreductase, partial [Candidatus Heimdallarchaeota archaeon]|nr:NAD(P)/FAD-dependent oxidoreductase [Candidatus Heimdallarchaeota archaeon]
MKNPNIVIVGAGTGGVIVANQIQKKLKKLNPNITIIDPYFRHTYQPGFLFTMFGKDETKNIVKDSRKLLNKKVHSIQDKVTNVNHKENYVVTENNGSISYDYLVLATGSKISTDAVDWWDDSIHHFYDPISAEKLNKELENFQEGNIVVSIADLPYKCPPAPIEAAMLMDSYFKERGIRDKVNITYTSPINRAFSIETTNTRVEPYLKEKNIEVLTFFNTDDVDTEEKVIYSLEGDDIDYDLLIMIPPHRGQQFLIESGISHGHGWIPTDKYTLKVDGFDNIYALGDATDIPTSKAGSTAHHQAPVIAENILAQIEG